jgi:hypothetical protein
MIAWLIVHSNHHFLVSLWPILCRADKSLCKPRRF